jgi:hypothetical protein
MELRGLEVRTSGATARLQCEVVTASGPETLWFEVPRAHAAHLDTERYDGLVVALLPRAMARGEDITVRGALSLRLHFNLAHFYMAVQAPLVRTDRAVRIHPDTVIDRVAEPRPRAAATGFSAGVDSFAALHDHFVTESRPGYRITHLLLNNVGSHGQRDPAAARRLFMQRHAAVRGYAEEAGLDLVTVDSNLDEVLGLDFEQTHTPRNVAVALLLQPLLGRFYYASTYRYADCGVRENFDSGSTDPIALPLLATETLDLVATGSQHTRVVKTALLAAVPGANRYLNVCTNAAAAGHNCSRCKKCARTQLTLEALGMLPDFGAVFSPTDWPATRDDFIAETLLGPRILPLSRELRSFLEAQGYRFTWRQRALALRHVIPKPLRRIGRRASRALSR